MSGQRYGLWTLLPMAVVVQPAPAPIPWDQVVPGRRLNCPAEGRRGCEGLNGFDFAHRIKGSVPVQARDHRKRRCNQLSADSNQRDFALAA